ncbi:50S ribosomal protein L34 [Candidatus Karelsulcia muelleri]
MKRTYNPSKIKRRRKIGFRVLIKKKKSKNLSSKKRKKKFFLIKIK